MPNAFVHVELNTDDLKGARAFYAKLFKWKIAPYPQMPSYLGVDAGKNATGGGMQKKPMPEAPTAWLPYVEVDDVKKTIAKARKLGAEIVVDFMPIGGGLRRGALCRDRSGNSRLRLERREIGAGPR